MKKFFAILLFPIMLSAEPGPVTQYLKHEPATLFDIGMMRLDMLTSSFQHRVGLYWTENGNRKRFRPEVGSYYDPRDDTIYVGFSIMNSEATELQMEEGCDRAMDQLGIWLIKSLPGLFQHVGDRGRSQSQDLHEPLRDMIVLRCYFSSGRDSSEGRFWASRPLGDPQMTIGRWPVRN